MASSHTARPKWKSLKVVGARTHGENANKQTERPARAGCGRSAFETQQIHRRDECLLPVWNAVKLGLFQKALTRAATVHRLSAQSSQRQMIWQAVSWVRKSARSLENQFVPWFLFEAQQQTLTWCSYLLEESIARRTRKLRQQNATLLQWSQMTNYFKQFSHKVGFTSKRGATNYYVKLLVALSSC